MDTVPSGSKYVFQLFTSVANVPTDAAANPPFAVMRSGTSIQTGAMGKVATGRYRADVALDSKYTVGEVYEVWATPTVGGKATVEAIGTFLVVVAGWGLASAMTQAEVQAMLGASEARIIAEIKKIPGGGTGEGDLAQN
jgi:hypothetical protein